MLLKPTNSNCCVTQRLLSVPMIEQVNPYLPILSHPPIQSKNELYNQLDMDCFPSTIQSFYFHSTISILSLYFLCLLVLFIISFVFFYFQVYFDSSITPLTHHRPPAINQVDHRPPISHPTIPLVYHLIIRKKCKRNHTDILKWAY